MSLKSFLLKIATLFLIPFIIYLLFPLYIFKSFLNPIHTLAVFYLLNGALFLFLFKRAGLKSVKIKLLIEELKEKINLVTEEYSKALNNDLALQDKNLRYNSLAKILEGINSTLILEEVSEILTNEAFSLINKKEGASLLYLINRDTQKPMLFKSKVEGEGIVIKAKEGDIFDAWVLRQARALLIEDIKNDFRFDQEKITLLYPRQVSSLISSPIMAENRQLGFLRLDHNKTHFYTQDDLRFLSAISDIGAIGIENSQLFQRAQDLAIHDSLTGLYTKSFFLSRFKEEHKRSLRQNLPLSLIMIDIDLFKQYNDRFGHTAGDIVLVKISKMIAASFKKFNPLISRFGGEEFCLAMPGLEKGLSFDAAESFRKDLEKKPFILRRNKTRITVSIGLANIPEDTLDDEELIRKADRAMYIAKKKGRNQVCCI